jgi:phage tail sheath protein FI
MATTFQTPGVYVKEVSLLPPSVAEVETAIPIFIGYTQSGSVSTPHRISSMLEYQTVFGTANSDRSLKFTLQSGTANLVHDVNSQSKFIMFYAMQLYFANGGGPCYIVSTGIIPEDENAPSVAEKTTPQEAYETALRVAINVEEPTIVVFPDAPFVIPDNYYALMSQAIDMCAKSGDRFLIIDVLDSSDPKRDVVTEFRDRVPTSEQAKYAAAYYPYLNTAIPYEIDEEQLSVVILDQVEPVETSTAAVKVEEGEAPKGKKEESTRSGAARGINKRFSELPNGVQNQIRQKITSSNGVLLAPSAAVAGVYAKVDRTRGVWKAPANVSLNYVQSTTVNITDEQQASLNIDVNAGKSINAIRSFVGQGTKIWGARTLAGNDNEWRYINVRRFFNMVEESVKKSTTSAVFEPNNVNTWTRVRAMIENYLLLKWKDGALAGAKPDDAYYVRVGLGQTMTPADVLEGRMNIEIGLAAVRPAEFIILNFSHKLQTG